MDFLWDLFLIITFTVISANVTVFLVRFFLKRIMKSKLSDKTLTIIGFSVYMLMFLAYLDTI